MLRPYDADLMKSYEVSRIVNSVKNDTPTCIEPRVA
jgi:putative SOS response-associated peptidase YedK